MLVINSAFEIRLENTSVKFISFHIIFQYVGKLNSEKLKQNKTYKVYKGEHCENASYKVYISIYIKLAFLPQFHLIFLIEDRLHLKKKKKKRFYYYLAMV